MTSAKVTEMEWWKKLTSGNAAQPVSSSVYARESDHVAELIVRRAQIKSSDRLLDAGCGDGNGAMALAVRGFSNITAIDQSRFHVAVARQRALRRGLRVSFVEGNPRHCPFPAGSFDAVTICGNAFGCTEDPRDDTEFLREALRLLRPLGALVLSIVDGNWLCQHYQPDMVETLASGIIYRRRDLSDDGTCLTTHEVVADQDSGLSTEHASVERLYTQGQLTTLLHLVGFKAISFDQQASWHGANDRIVPRYFITCRAADSCDVATPGAMMARSA